ncbi:MAG: hypothetical protein QW292_08475 [Candidatus Parvarchaeota archaeon]
MSHYLDFLENLIKHAKVSGNLAAMALTLSLVIGLAIIGLPLIVWDLYEYRKKKRMEHPDFIKVVK